MPEICDVAIIGAGAMGSAAAYHLSKTKKKTLLLDQFFPPHNQGSSHGDSRIIREAYFESPLYVPLVQKAYRLWDELEQESSKQLFIKTGGLMLGDAGSKVFNGAERSAEQYNIWYEVLDSAAISKKFPALKPAEKTLALYEKNAGLLFPELCIQSHLQLAEKSNLHFCFGEKVNAVAAKNNLIEIQTDKSIYHAEKVIVSAGAWLGKLFPDLQLPLQVARQVLLWFDFKTTNPEFFSPQQMPVFIWEYEKNKMFYGFPALNNKLKIAIHHEGATADADTIDRNVHDDEIKKVISIAENFLNAKLHYSHSSVCMYTNTPTEDFIIDYHPANKNIIIASPCSGHGFKFSSAIGKLLCNMVCDEDLDFDIKPFSISLNQR